MSRLLVAWELGTGLGHVGRFLPLANTLHARGHQIVIAAKQLSTVCMFSGSSLPYPVLAIPAETSPCRKTFANTSTYVQLLHNAGFGDLDYLRLRVEAWLDLFQLVKPEVVLCDHSPMAQLAARIAGIKFVLLGTGFTCPPAHAGLPNNMSRQPTSIELQQQQESLLLQHCAAISLEHHASALEQFSDLYAEAAGTLLLTHAELDHFPERIAATYFGSWNFVHGKKPVFPLGHGPKVFGYLKPSPGVEDLLAELRRLKWPALIVGTGFSDDFIKTHSSETLIVANQPVDQATATAWCDFSILNATHASVAVTLRAGKPILCLPLQLEQLLMSRRINELQMGEAVVAQDAASCSLGLKLMAERLPELSKRAQVFADRYQSYDPQQAVEVAADQIEVFSRPG